MATRKKAAPKKEETKALSVPGAVADVPAFMQNEDETGLANIQQYISPPRLKVVQTQSRKPFSEMFNAGDLVVVPQMEVVAPIMLNNRGKPEDHGQPFLFTPLFFFPEWVLWNPIEVPGLNSVRDRTFDEDHEIALRAKNPNARSMPCPEDEEYDCRFVEHLNFLFMLHNDSIAAGTPCLYSFARGEWRSGSNFLSLLNMRSGGRTPMYGMNFAGQVHFRNRNSNEWYGIDVANPEDDFGPAFVQDADTYEQYKAIHLQLREAHDKSMIQVDYDDGEQAEEITDM